MSCSGKNWDGYTECKKAYIFHRFLKILTPKSKSRQGSVSAKGNIRLCLLNLLNLAGSQSLDERCRIHRLTLMYQIQCGLIVIKAGSILRSNEGHTASISHQHLSQCTSSLSTLGQFWTGTDCQLLTVRN